MLKATISISQISLGNVCAPAVLQHLAIHQAAFTVKPSAYNCKRLEACLYLYQQVFFCYGETLVKAVKEYEAVCAELEPESESDTATRIYERNHC